MKAFDAKAGLGEPVRGAAICRHIAMFLLFGAILFASGDVWPTVTVGFTFRFSQLLVFAALLLLVPTMVREGIVVGGYMIPAALWVVFSFLVLPLSLLPIRSFPYTFWLVTDLLTIFAFLQAFRSTVDVGALMRTYMHCFLLLAAFGVVQLIAGVLGVDLLVQEWWVADALPRINGLSYEPSYYATYLLPGWVTSAYLVEKQSDIVSRPTLKLVLITTTAALLLSTSRLGWVLMAFWIAFRASLWFIRFLAGARLSRTRLGTLGGCTLVVGMFVISPIGSVFVRQAAEALSAVSFLLNGLGIFGAPAHSFRDRLQGFLMTWEAFQSHPWLGTGLGAVPVEIARIRHAPMQNLEDAKTNEGMSTALELLASIGVIGVILAGAFAVMVAFQWWRAFSVSDRQHRVVLLGAGWGLIWLLLALQFNQNFLRIYLWMDVGVVLVVANLLVFRRNALVGRV